MACMLHLCTVSFHLPLPGPHVAYRPHLLFLLCVGAAQGCGEKEAAAPTPLSARGDPQDELLLHCAVTKALERGAAPLFNGPIKNGVKDNMPHGKMRGYRS